MPISFREFVAVCEVVTLHGVDVNEVNTDLTVKADPEGDIYFVQIAEEGKTSAHSPIMVISAGALSELLMTMGMDMLERQAGMHAHHTHSTPHSE